MACLNFPLFTSEACDENEMITESVNVKVARLEERVDGHIRFFWKIVAFQFACLGGLLWLGLQTKLAVTGVAQSEANMPAQIVASLLNSPVTTQNDAEANLSAAASVLQTAKVGKVKPDTAKLKAISDKLLDDQNQYPELPQVWTTTGVFINYKFQALLPSAAEVAANADGKPCKLQLPPLKLQNCDVNLEEIAAQFTNNTTNGKPISFTFVNCVVHYSGGALPDGPMEFTNSVLVFHVTVVPPRNAINAMRQLAQAETVDQFRIQG